MAGERSRVRTPEGHRRESSTEAHLQRAVAELEVAEPTAPRKLRLTRPRRPEAGTATFAAVDAVEAGETQAVTATVGRRRWAAPLIALVVALALLAVVVGVSLRDPGAQARTDRAAASQARTSIEQLLSYNYKTIDAQAAQVEGLLTGSFKGEFSAAMAKDIKPLAVQNQTVVQAKVSDLGVMSSSDRTVKVLAFVNQARVGTDQKEPVVDQNRVIATLTKVGDRWLISKLEAF
ncbi:Mce-associated membrane protein [Pedococcus dokdonensis]|uniref:Mce-associated membrane protein n=1 Tax=Pedococcus dokdonensis TaxID=443156 RepID=A0A1H0V7W0_9MICO|nr:hypothetical protein [Pedococcus dokdonensis]SDP74463.1 Mce-associated membrane protein [Pedococcus dokdonensis]